MRGKGGCRLWRSRDGRVFGRCWEGWSVLEMGEDGMFSRGLEGLECLLWVGKMGYVVGSGGDGGLMGWGWGLLLNLFEDEEEDGGGEDE